MKFQFANPWYLALLPWGWAWVIWLAWKSDVQISRWRRATSLVIRLLVLTCLGLGLAGWQWLRPIEGMNIFFLLDRSDSVPSTQQEAAREYVNRISRQKPAGDKSGLIVFGAEAAIEFTPNRAVDVQKIQAVVPTVGTDIGSAIRLGTAAFPETGQKRLVLLTDGNENIGEGMGALVAARTLGVTLDVVPMGVARGGDVLIQKVGLPAQLKKGQTYEVKIFTQADEARPATLRLFRNDQFLGEQRVELEAGKNLFSFSETLTEPGFYSYDVQLEAAGDAVPQNNRAVGFTRVWGDPRVLIVSADPATDRPLQQALQSARLEVNLTALNGFPANLAAMQSYDALFLSNIAAGDLGPDLMRLLESAVKDFGIGLVCIGGDQSYSAGGYRGTPLEETLPVSMELDSKKVLPSGALVLVVHATEFPNGNAWARDIAFAALDALGPQDEMGIVLWDGTDRWLFALTKVGDKKELGRKIAGMNPGDMVSFQGVMTLAHDALKKSTANLKHMVVFSDGDPQAPSKPQVEAIVQDKITLSTVMIGGHVTPEVMVWMADMGRGRFYDVRSPGQLPQIFIKEAAVILKSAIFEEPFKPQQAAGSEVVRGIAPADYPPLRGYVATSYKARAETPLVSDKGDPLLAHWQYGLGRAVAFTSDARAKWAADWIGWSQYRQFWSQVAQWSLRRLDLSDFSTEIAVENGQGTISVEALDPQGDYRNFLTLQTAVVGPNGQRQTVLLEQTGPGRYEGRFMAREVGAYLLNLMDMKEGEIRSSQVLGASVNYSPEFNASGSNLHLLERLAEAGRGQVLRPDDLAANPFLRDRQRTYQPLELWEWLLKLAVLLFPLDVAVRRIQLDRAEWLRATENLRRWLFFWRGVPRPAQADESLAALLARRSSVRATTPAAARPELFQAQTTAPVPGARLEEPAAPELAAAEPAPASSAAGQPATTTSRLLDAKRRAQRRNP